MNEILWQNECKLEDLILPTQFVNGCIEEDTVEIAGWSSGVEKGIFGGWPEGGGSPVTWNNIFFNQLTVSPWSCFYMANFTALANNYQIDIPQSAILEGWQELVDERKFIPNVWGKMTDGTEKAVKIFNNFAGKNVRAIYLPFSIENIVTALKSGSNFVFWLKYWPTFFKNEQDDGIIQNIAGTTGGNGHLVCGIKANTTDDLLFKYAEQYHWEVKKEIILLDIVKYPELFMNNLAFFAE